MCFIAPKLIGGRSAPERLAVKALPVEVCAAVTTHGYHTNSRFRRLFN